MTFVHDEWREIYGLVRRDDGHDDLLGDLYESVDSAERAGESLNAANPGHQYDVCACRLNLGQPPLSPIP